jgi:hypothetical protein
MILVENAMLIAVRQAIVEAGICNEYEVDIEIDDQAPAVAGDQYIALSSENIQIDNYRNPEAFHGSFGFRAAAYQRITAIPRDRRRSIYFDLLLNLNDRLDAVSRLFHFNGDFICLVNGILVDLNIQGKFTTPLELSRIDTKPRAVGMAEYAAKNTGSGESVIALCRGIGFAGAKFVGFK